MQDRFRYRVFDNDDRKMHDVIFLNYENNSVEWYNDNNKKRAAFIEEVPTLQCTGLKDKNAKLIYEGDIIKIPNDYDSYGMFAGEKREVYFYEGGFRLKPKWDKNSRGNWLEDTNAFEVVGNIYENSELLREGNNAR